MEFTPVECNETAYSEYSNLFASCFPGVNKFNKEYLNWLYHKNPDGDAVGFDARDGDRLVAHYVCIPAIAQIGNQEVRVLLSLNTATHPNYQGQGLFTKLANLTYAAGKEQAYDSVYGIANANSTPGFTRKLNFQLVGPLRACAGVGSLGINFSSGKTPEFRRIWSQEALAWRCANPANPLFVKNGQDRATFLAPALNSRAVLAAAEIDTIAHCGKASTFNSPLRIFIGMVPADWRRSSAYVDIPNRLRPSPLNLIYRSLSGRFENIDPDSVFLSFLDFDAY